MKKHYKIIAMVLAVITAMAVPMLASAGTSPQIVVVLNNARYRIILGADVLSPIRTKGTLSADYISGSIPEYFDGYIESIAYDSSGEPIGYHHKDYQFGYTDSFSVYTIYTAPIGKTVAAACTACSFLGSRITYGPTT